MPFVTLTEFLLARFEETEGAARAASWGPRWVMAHDLPNTNPAVRDHIMYWEPARVLAEVEANRRIVEQVVPYLERIEGAAIDGGMYDDPPHASHDLLRLLALPYAGHPDCRQAVDAPWQPDTPSPSSQT